MPYILPERRMCVDAAINDVASNIADMGDFNYAVTKLALSFNPQRYVDFNAIIGVLECCKLEFYRRAVAAYENTKIASNGDVDGFKSGSWVD